MVANSPAALVLRGSAVKTLSTSIQICSCSAPTANVQSAAHRSEYPHETLLIKLFGIAPKKPTDIKPLHASQQHYLPVTNGILPIIRFDLCLYCASKATQEPRWSTFVYSKEAALIATICLLQAAIEDDNPGRDALSQSVIVGRYLAQVAPTSLSKVAATMQHDSVSQTASTRSIVLSEIPPSVLVAASTLRRCSQSRLISSCTASSKPPCSSFVPIATLAAVKRLLLIMSTNVSTSSAPVYHHVLHPYRPSC